MSDDDTVFLSAFAALSHPLRLGLFRRLMTAGPNGLSAGELGREFEVPASTLSGHLAHLVRGGLLRSSRQSQRILYAVDVEGTRRLIAYLTDECCGGRPELCGYRGGAQADSRPLKEAICDE